MKVNIALDDSVSELVSPQPAYQAPGVNGMSMSPLPFV